MIFGNKFWFQSFRIWIYLLGFDLNFRILAGLDNNLIRRREGELFCHRHKARSSPVPQPHWSVLGESIIICGEKQQWVQHGLDTIWATVNTWMDHIILFRIKWNEIIQRIGKIYNLWSKVIKFEFFIKWWKEAKEAKKTTNSVSEAEKGFLSIFLGWERASPPLSSAFLPAH